MPTYEYKNIETGEIYEFKQSMRDDALTHHPETGAPIKRIVSVPGIAFKGSGFYATDSRASTSGGTKSTKSEGTAGSDGAATASTAASTPAKEPAKPAASTGGE
jgi:putative FmdB family regulatory protein